MSSPDWELILMPLPDDQASLCISAMAATSSARRPVQSGRWCLMQPHGPVKVWN